MWKLCIVRILSRGIFTLVFIKESHFRVCRYEYLCCIVTLYSHFPQKCTFADNLQKVNLSVCMNELWFLQLWISVHPEDYLIFILGWKYQSVLDSGTLTCFGCVVVFSTIRKYILFLGSYIELPVMCSFLKVCQKWGILV